MCAETNRKRRSPGRTHDKLAISMPHDTVTKAREQMKESGVSSLSAYITQVVEEKLQERTFDDILDEVFREKPMTDEERVWADSILDP